MREKKKKYKIGTTGVSGINAVNPNVKAKEITDPSVLDQNKLFKEAARQCKPISGKQKIVNGKEFIEKNTARKHGLKSRTVKRMITKQRKFSDFTKGANPQGKTKEIVATYEYRELQNGNNSGFVNPPKHTGKNVKDIRLSPDDASKRDILFVIEDKKGRLILRPGGQVKSGDAEYITKSLCEMANKDGYGKTAILDSRFANTDGTPRVGKEAFTPTQARRIKEAGIRLRGVKNLDERGEKLLENLLKSDKDGLNPVEREQLVKLRDDIARAYGGKAIAGRVLGGAAIGFATAAIVSMFIQYKTNHKIEVKPLFESSGKAAGSGVAGVLADVALYKAGIKMGKAPEVAQAFAKQGVTIGFCLLAAGMDLASEIKSACSGENSTLDSIVGSTLKVGMDLLPIVLAPLGFAGVPIAVGTQIGGRYLITAFREDGAEIERILEDCTPISDRIENCEQSIQTMCEDMDGLFRELGLESAIN